MHGVGHTLTGLADFVGSKLSAIDDLENIVYFRFSQESGADLLIGVESEWSIEDASGEIVMHGSPRPDSHVENVPLGSTVTATQTQPPDTILLCLTSGYALRIVDTSAEYESFCIPHAGTYV